MEDIKTYQGRGKYIFVSYSHQDKLKVLPIIKALQSKYNVWYDNGIGWGEEYKESIVKHINNCSLFIYMVSTNSLKSDFCKNEIAQAVDKKIEFINVVIEDCLNTDEAELFLFDHRNYQMVYLYQIGIRDFVNDLENRVPSVSETKRDCGANESVFTFLDSNVEEGEIQSDTKIRISYAGYVIFKINNQYLLVMNTHGLDLYQLCARTYRLDIKKREEYIAKFKAEIDDYIREDDLYDYRLLIPANELENFYKAFLEEIDPCKYDYSDIVYNIVKRCGLDKNIFENPKTSFVKRIIRPITFSRYTNHYEMVLSDVNIFEPNEEQLKELERISKISNDEYRFATIKEIKANGVDIEKGKRRADIATYVYDVLSSAFEEKDL